MSNLRQFYNTQCRFRLKSGKEVYGVIWEVAVSEKSELYFTSLSNAEHVFKAKNDKELSKSIGLPLSAEEIIMAERLVG